MLCGRDCLCDWGKDTNHDPQHPLQILFILITSCPPHYHYLTEPWWSPENNKKKRDTTQKNNI